MYIDLLKLARVRWSLNAKSSLWRSTRRSTCSDTISITFRSFQYSRKPYKNSSQKSFKQFHKKYSKNIQTKKIRCRCRSSITIRSASKGEEERKTNCLQTLLKRWTKRKANEPSNERKENISKAEWMHLTQLVIAPLSSQAWNPIRANYLM